MPGETMAPHAGPDTKLNRVTILVVDDEELVRTSTAEFLRYCDFNVVEAGNADEAMTLLATGFRVDFVFSDVRMPGPHDGFDIAGWVRANRPGTPVLLTSGYLGPAPVVDGAPRILAKPYSFQSLLKLINTMLHQRGRATAS